MQDFSSEQYRKEIIDEILGAENIARKGKSFKRSEIYKYQQAPYIEEKIKAEFPKSASAMRKITSINIAPRIIDEQSKLYAESPKRTFTNNAGEVLQESELTQIDVLYKMPNADTTLLKSNRIKTLQHQCILQVVPKRARQKIDLKVFQPHQIDCVPREDDPEEAFGYIISAFDRSKALATGDGKDQKIADVNDMENPGRKKMRFVFWSAIHNMITDGYGVIMQEDPSKILNPIGRLPFVDISKAKENEFWVREGSPTTDFAIDYAVILSDTCNTNRAQSYSQAVISSKDKPTEMELGPNTAFWLQRDPNSTTQDTFEFVSPNPDMAASLELFDKLLNIFLSSIGLDPKTVNTKGEARSFSSGYERLLAMLKEFEASREDIALYQWAESELFEILKAWHNAFIGTSDSFLSDDYKLTKISDDAKVKVEFAKPELVQTKADVEDSAIKLLDKEIISLVQAAQEIFKLDEKQAVEHVTKVLEHKRDLTKMKTEMGLDQPKALPEGQGAQEVQDELPLV